MHGFVISVTMATTTLVCNGRTPVWVLGLKDKGRLRIPTRKQLLWVRTRIHISCMVGKTEVLQFWLKSAPKYVGKCLSPQQQKPHDYEQPCF